MIRHSIKSLNTTTAVELTIEDSLNGVNTFIVENTSETANVYIGNQSVSTSNYGFLLYPKQAFTAELRPFDRLYGVASITTSVACMSIERST
jgi:hypothetical protein